MDDVWWFLYNALSLKIGYPNQFPSFGQSKRTPPKTPGHFPQSARRVPECPLAAYPVLQSQAAAPLSGGQLLAIFLRNGLIQKVCWGNPFSTGTFVRKVLSGRQMGVYHVDVEPKKIQQTFGLRNIWKQMGFPFTLVFLLFSFFFLLFCCFCFFPPIFSLFFFPFWLSIFSPFILLPVFFSFAFWLSMCFPFFLLFFQV